jgi:hypothetical protein
LPSRQAWRTDCCHGCSARCPSLSSARRICMSQPACTLQRPSGQAPRRHRRRNRHGEGDKVKDRCRPAAPGAPPREQTRHHVQRARTRTQHAHYSTFRTCLTQYTPLTICDIKPARNSP